MPWFVPVLIVIVVPAMTLLAAFGVSRAWARRARRRERGQARGLVACIEAHLAGHTSAAELRRAVARAETGTFWCALETLVLEPRRLRWRPLSGSLAGNPHARHERRALRDDSAWRRELAARRLALIAEPASRRALRSALGRGPEIVTLAAALALGRYRDARALRWLIAHPQALARRTARAQVAALRAYGRGALPLFARALEDTGDLAGLERALIETLGLGGYAPAVAAIERRLSGPAPEVQVAAARALGRLEAASSVPALLTALNDEAWPVRAVAAWALGRIGAAAAPSAAPAIAPLAARLTDRAWWVRRHAAYALWENGEAGRAALRQIADTSPDPYARDMAREALGAGTGLDAA
jgi:HEAT repeat protein